MAHQAKFKLGGIELDIVFTYTAGRAAITNAPAEDCYPAEDAECEILEVTSNGVDYEIDDIAIRIGGEFTSLDVVLKDYIIENIEDIL